MDKEDSKRSLKATSNMVSTGKMITFSINNGRPVLKELPYLEISMTGTGNNIIAKEYNFFQF
jgi:hypothetical protein